MLTEEIRDAMCFLNAACEYDKEEDTTRALEHYLKALNLLLAGSKEDIESLGLHLDGGVDDAKSLITRTLDRVEQLKIDLKTDNSSPPHLSPTQHTSNRSNSPFSPNGSFVGSQGSLNESNTPVWDELATPRDSPPSSPTSCGSVEAQTLTQLSSSSLFLDPEVSLTPCNAFTKGSESDDSWSGSGRYSTDVYPNSDSDSSEVTENDLLEMSLVIKNLDTGEVSLIEEDAPIITSTEPVSKPTGSVSKPVPQLEIRNLDTGEVIHIPHSSAPQKKKGILSYFLGR